MYLLWNIILFLYIQYNFFHHWRFFHNLSNIDNTVYLVCDSPIFSILVFLFLLWLYESPDHLLIDSNQYNGNAESKQWLLSNVCDSVIWSHSPPGYPILPVSVGHVFYLQTIKTGIVCLLFALLWFRKFNRITS